MKDANERVEIYIGVRVGGKNLGCDSLRDHGLCLHREGFGHDAQLACVGCFDEQL